MGKSRGPVVKWYYIAFALRRREFDSRQVHKEQSTRCSAFVNNHF